MLVDLLRLQTTHSTETIARNNSGNDTSRRQMAYTNVKVWNGEQRRCLNQIGNIHGHLLDLSIVERLNVLQYTMIFAR